MTFITIGARLISERKKLQWNQATLSRRSGISAARLSQLESDRRHPSKKEWARLDTCLSVGAYPEPVGLPCPDGQWRAGRPLLPLPERPISARDFAARKRFGSVVDRAWASIRSRQAEGPSVKFLHWAGLDSSCEYLFWLRLLENGGKACCYSPARAGFRSLSVVHRDLRTNIGDLRLPCLEILIEGFAPGERCWRVDSPGFRCLFFPQITLDSRKGYYRIDALACIRIGRSRFWLDLEVDGKGHDSTFDVEREARLGLKTVRLGTTDLTNEEFVDCLGDRIALSLAEAGVG